MSGINKLVSQDTCMSGTSQLVSHDTCMSGTSISSNGMIKVVLTTPPKASREDICPKECLPELITNHCCWILCDFWQALIILTQVLPNLTTWTCNILFLTSLASFICHPITNVVHGKCTDCGKYHKARGYFVNNIYFLKYYVNMFDLTWIIHTCNCQCDIKVQYYTDIYTYFLVQSVYQKTYVSLILVGTSIELLK